MWREQLIQVLCDPSADSTRLEDLFILKNRALPPSIFKYRQFTDNAVNNLENNTVWLADPASFNDPYDSAFNIAADRLATAVGNVVAPELAEKAAAERIISPDDVAAIATAPDSFDRLVQALTSSDSSMPTDRLSEFLSVLQRIVVARQEKVIESAVARIRSSLKLCSFSELNDSITMWAHYGGMHSGFCIEYPINQLPANDLRRRLLFPVIYSNDLIDCTEIFARPLTGVSNNIFPLGACLQKSRDWAYEKEWRLVMPGGIFRTPRAIEMPTPSAVYLGTRVSVIDEAKLTRIAQGKGIAVFKMVVSSSSFKLVAASV